MTILITHTFDMTDIYYYVQILKDVLSRRHSLQTTHIFTNFRHLGIESRRS